jgi:hypothetical protein
VQQARGIVKCSRAEATLYRITLPLSLLRVAFSLSRSLSRQKGPALPAHANTLNVAHDYMRLLACSTDAAKAVSAEQNLRAHMSSAKDVSPAPLSCPPPTRPCPPVHTFRASHARAQRRLTQSSARFRSGTRRDSAHQTISENAYNCAQIKLRIQSAEEVPTDLLKEKGAWLNEKATMAAAITKLAQEKELLENDKAILSNALARSTKRIAELISECTLRKTSTMLSRAPTNPVHRFPCLASFRNATPSRVGCTSRRKGVALWANGSSTECASWKRENIDSLCSMLSGDPSSVACSARSARSRVCCGHVQWNALPTRLGARPISR